MPPHKKAQSQNSRKKSEKHVIQSAQVSYSGPLPPPAALKQYEDITAGLADRIVQMAESEMTHRHQIEAKAIDADIRLADSEYIERRIGQFLGF